MNTFSPHIRYIALSAQLLSLLLHLVIFNNIIFTFSLKPQGHKPAFIFLGSILKGQDLTITASQETPAQPHWDADRFLGKSIITSEQPFGSIEAEKPIIPQSMKLHDKRTLKSSFLKSSEPQKSDRGIKAEDIGVDTNLKPYAPLKLKLP